MDLALVIATALGGTLLLFVLPPLLAGWRQLSHAYPTTVALPVRSPYTVTPYIGWPALAARIGVGADKEGLYFEPRFPASLALSPVFIPWVEITSRDAGLWRQYTELRGGRCPNVAIYLLAGQYKELCSHWGRDAT